MLSCGAGWGLGAGKGTGLRQGWQVLYSALQSFGLLGVTVPSLWEHC